MGKNFDIKFKSSTRIGLCLWLMLSALAVNAQTLKQLDDVVNSYVERGEFSGAVLVARNGKILLKEAYGYADFERKIKNKTNTKFLIGSTTKSFTAVTVLQLAERGLLELNEPISKYLPTLKPAIGRMTLHQLMKMTSGLQGHLGRVTELKHEDITATEMVALINQSELSFEPGTDYEYSNLNYQLAACIVAKVSGLSYGEALKKYTFGPLKMSGSGAETASVKPANKALGYDVDATKRMSKARRNYMSYALGSGDVYSTIEDIFLWDRALAGNDYLNESSLKMLFDGTPGVYDGYGYGFKVREYERARLGQKGKLVRHGGSMQGYVANFHRYLDDDITVIILGNIRPFPITDITFDLKEIVLGRKAGREGKEFRYE